MKIETIKGKIIKRINRFQVLVAINKKKILAHLNNTGRLKEFMKKGRICYLTLNPFRVSIIRMKNYGAVIDTNLQMKFFEELIKENKISWLNNANIIKRNPRFNNSVFDYLIEWKKKKYYVEVKSAVFKNGDFAMYPDCPSIRGQKQIKDLLKIPNRALIVFIAGLPNVKYFSPNKNADPNIYELLKEAKRKKMLIKTIQIGYDYKTGKIVLLNDNLKVII